MYSETPQMISWCSYSFTLILYTVWATFSTAYIQETVAAQMSWCPCGQKFWISKYESVTCLSQGISWFSLKGKLKIFKIIFPGSSLYDKSVTIFLFFFNNCFLLWLELVIASNFMQHQDMPSDISTAGTCCTEIE